MSDATPKVLKGHCLCGACKFELTGPHNWVGHCHCESCRRAASPHFTTWIGHENGAWRFTGAEAVSYVSSPGNTRGFCATCGSPIYFKSDRFPNEMHFYAALLEDPGDVEPAIHFHADEMLPWVHLSDGLPFKDHSQ